MRMPIYIAGSSRETTRVREMAERLQETGLVRIVHAWWRHVEEIGVGKDGDLGTEEQAHYASADLMAVADAKVFLALWPEHPSEGMCTEYGYALGVNGLTTIVAGPQSRRCIFAALAHCRTEHDEAACDAVVAIAKDYARKSLPDVSGGMERP